MTNDARELGPFRIGIVADDLTGALDTGAGFAKAGMRVRVVLGPIGDTIDFAGADAVVVNTASREGRPDSARAATRDATITLVRSGVTLLYKKVDSTFRGHPGPEVAGVLSALPPGTRALVAPAFPAQARVTRNGVQYVHGLPAPHFGGHLATAFAEVSDACDFHDADDEANLHAIATMGIDGGVRVWVGTAGLAAVLVPALIEKGLHLSSHEGNMVDDAPWHDGRPVVVVAGSVHPTTVAQVAALASTGVTHVVLDPQRPGTWPSDNDLDHAICSGLCIVSTHAALRTGSLSHDRLDGEAQLLDLIAGALQRSLEMSSPPALLVIGGETAQGLFRRLGAMMIDVTGEVLPGIPTGRVHVGSMAVPIVTKSGGFGTTGDLITICRAARS
jgi:uncharacterized protein YgbK (DUF1537 family)